jgi:hypothetical protein
MFIVECKPDAILIKSLTPASRKVKHAGNKPLVLRKLMRNYKNSTGIIDEDPQSIQPPDMRRFREIKFSEEDKFKVLHHKQRNNRLLVLCPRLEEWIIEASREANIDLRGYGLPNDPDELHETINIGIERFQRLVRELKKRSSRVKALQAHLKMPTRKVKT